MDCAWGGMTVDREVQRTFFKFDGSPVNQYPNEFFDAKWTYSLLPSESLAVNGKLRRCNEFWRHSHLGCGADGHLACWLWIGGQGRPPAPQAEEPVLLLA